jgi:hypothetical protein
MGEGELQILSPEEQTRYRNYEELFGTDGWKVMIRELSERVGQLVNSALTTITNEKDLYFQKGLVQASLTIINLEASIQAEIENRLSEAALAREEDEASKGSNA